MSWSTERQIAANNPAEYDDEGTQPSGCCCPSCRPKIMEKIRC